jgi:hypothetical protein
VLGWTCCLLTMSASLQQRCVVQILTLQHCSLDDISAQSLFVDPPNATPPRSTPSSLSSTSWSTMRALGS